MNKILLVLTSQIILGVSTQSCSSLSTLDQSQLWKIMVQTQLEEIINLIGGVISVILLLITIASWKLYPAFSMPADIIFVIAIFQFIQSVSLIASASYFIDDHSQDIPSNFEASCLAIGILYIIGSFGSLLYNLLFCLLLSFSIRKTLKGSIFNQKRYHIFAIVTITILVVSLSVSSKIGVEINGICGYKVAGRESIAKFIVELFICLCCIFCMIKFKTKIPKNQYFSKVSVFGFYFYYISIFSLVQIAQTVSFMIGNIACRTGSDYSSDIIRISLILSNTFSYLLSFVLCILRFSHPILQIKIKRFFKKQYGDFEQAEFNPNEEPWLGCLLESIKGSQIISFIAGILIGFAEHQYKIPQSSSTSLLYKKNYVMHLNEDITDQYILRRINSRQSTLVRQKLQGLQALDYQVTVFSIGVFSSMISREENINIFKSFNINLNIPLIKKSSNINGGKSGEFFFKTYDHRFIMKTIREDEAQIYLDKISDFYTYFQNNPSSFISKILGLYKFSRRDVNEQPVYLIIMKNISPVDSSNYERVYDIKGSEFNRQTLMEKKVSDPDKIRKLTLKDLDFHKLEGKVLILDTIADKIKKQITKDAQFLGSMGVIDYSVLIVKRTGPATSEEDLNEFVSTAEEGIRYNIGIIDYLQSWTLKRKAERAFKMLITSKKITVNEPEAYRQRFTENLDRIF